MRSTRPERLIVAVFAALAMSVLMSARAAFSQDAGDSAARADASLEGTAPVLDGDAESEENVLEIPQLKCAGGSDEDADADAASASSPGAPPTLDDDTADAGQPNQDWGTPADYQNQPVYAVPYAVYSYQVTVAVGTMNGILRPGPTQAYALMSSPLTQAARPPLNPGPWMLSPWMSPFSHPAGSRMMGRTMSHPFSGFHH
jgi:hypothetical protein